jgi:hypothetical protein
VVFSAVGPYSGWPLVWFIESTLLALISLALSPRLKVHSLQDVHSAMSGWDGTTKKYYTIDGLYLRYAATRRQREREVVHAVKLLKQNRSTEL